MERYSCRVNDNPGGCRLDRYISLKLNLLSRSQLKTRISRVLVNGKQSKLSKRIKRGDRLDIFYAAPPQTEILAEDIDLQILYEDRNVTVINKPRGMVVHPARGNYSGTLVNALLFHSKSLRASFPEEQVRPGIVHRLDRDTSGVIITAKNPEAHEFLALQFRKKEIVKIYLAIVKGAPPQRRGTIETGIRRSRRNRKLFSVCRYDGKNAVTSYKVLKSFPGYSLLAIKPHTGRTHQIRVHARYMRCPLLGDPLYSRRDVGYPETGLMLHARSLKVRLPGLEHPEQTVFRAPLPADFIEVLRRMQNNL